MDENERFLDALGILCGIQLVFSRWFAKIKIEPHYFVAINLILKECSVGNPSYTLVIKLYRV